MATGKNQALSFLSTTLTQGSADAFVQAQIATALSGLTKTAYLLRTMEVMFSGKQGMHNVDNEISVSLTRKSFSASPTVLEKSLIHLWKRTVAFTTSGAIVGSGNDRIIFPDESAPLIVEDPIYAQLDSTTTSATLIVYLRLGYVPITISELDRLTLVSNSLS